MMLKIINLAMFGLMITMNYLANALPINNKTTGQLSAQYPNLFVPAGITFSIWGVIYLLLFAFVILQFRESNRTVVQQIGWAFAISCLLNALWIVSWHYEQLPLSLIIMLGLLASLVYIGIKIYPLSSGLTKAVFGIYLGWICIATIANTTALLVNYQWGGWGIGDQAWTMIIISAGLIIASLVLIRLNNPFIGLAVIWAFAGIILNRWGTHPLIVTTAFISIGIITLLTLLMFIPRIAAILRTGIS